ncbi:MAG: ABC-2 family transporter protein [Bacteroidota bacterium]|nr:ABC-2 family transporter protein [Bacteroidota bacterium]MDP4232187.1 ABC-2 family transporter protein [Bacteroidota bacterium]MDP4241105.1 ABC-2 family transporter protein [Bacteroidota bacterium]MDP4286497.1 ABC-2 family transporter protein [Bacteroidota bacterium]
MIQHILRRLQLSIYFTRTSILSAMEFRTSFLMQVIGMFVNDAAFTVLWYIFFQSFPTVNGWAWLDTAMLIATTTLSFSLVFIFAKGAMDLAVTVRLGELDYYLAFPADVLWHLSVSRTRIDAIGDMIFGITIFLVFGHVTLVSFVALIVASAGAACVMYGFIVITQSLAFYTPNIEDAARDIFELLLGFSFYPQNIFTGGIRAVTIFVIPAFFTATIPERLIARFEWPALGALLLAGALSLSVAAIFFRYSMKRYESGNLMVVRT